MHESGRRDDRDLAERIEREQIAIAGHDQGSMAVDGQLEKFVVRGITARCREQSSSMQRLDFLLRLLDQPVDVVIAQTGSDDPHP